MLKIDIHTHIIPDNLPDFSKRFGYDGFVRLDKNKNDSEADMILFNEKFRTIKCNCWSPQERITEMNNFDIDVQVISPIPIMFSYWAEAKDALEQSQLINDFISGVCEKYPKKCPRNIQKNVQQTFKKTYKNIQKNFQNKSKKRPKIRYV